MKKIIITLSIIILALFTIQSHAQNIEGSYSCRIGDNITKQVVEYVPDEKSFIDQGTVSDLCKETRIIKML